MRSSILGNSHPTRRALTTDALVTRATEVLGDFAIAAEWLNTPIHALEGRKPVEMWRGTLSDQRQVFTILGRIEHGIF